jgi:hypothetical protein
MIIYLIVKLWSIAFRKPREYRQCTNDIGVEKLNRVSIHLPTTWDNGHTMVTGNVYAEECRKVHNTNWVRTSNAATQMAKQVLDDAVGGRVLTNGRGSGPRQRHKTTKGLVARREIVRRWQVHIPTLTKGLAFGENRSKRTTPTKGRTTLVMVLR